MKLIIYQIFGTIAAILSIVALLCKNKKKLLKVQLLAKTIRRAAKTKQFANLYR